MPMKGHTIPAEASEALRKRGLSLIARPDAPPVDEISFDENDALEAAAEDLDPINETTEERANEPE